MLEEGLDTRPDMRSMCLKRVVHVTWSVTCLISRKFCEQLNFTNFAKVRGFEIFLIYGRLFWVVCAFIDGLVRMDAWTDGLMDGMDALTNRQKGKLGLLLTDIQMGG